MQTYNLYLKTEIHEKSKTNLMENTYSRAIEIVYCVVHFSINWPIDISFMHNRLQSLDKLYSSIYRNTITDDLFYSLAVLSSYKSIRSRKDFGILCTLNIWTIIQIQLSFVKRGDT